MQFGEFELIESYFARPGVQRADVALAIGDDCALLISEPNQLIAISTDTLVAGVHFLPEISAKDLAYKALAVNLSDLAAMGAIPTCVSLAITLPEVDEIWLNEFSESFFSTLEYYQVPLIGGDTTKGPLSLTLTVHGTVPVGRELRRKGAVAGDLIYVTGTLGDSAAGLAILQKHLLVKNEKAADFLLQRHLRPVPRLNVGLGLQGIASSAIDLSDGLVTDLGHILKASCCGAKINVDKLPLSSAIRSVVTHEQAIQWALAGGEDYELCFTLPEKNRGLFETQLNHTNVAFQCIGQITNQVQYIQFLQDGCPIELNLSGYDHFK